MPMTTAWIVLQGLMVRRRQLHRRAAAIKEQMLDPEFHLGWIRVRPLFVPEG